MSKLVNLKILITSLQIIWPFSGTATLITLKLKVLTFTKPKPYHTKLTKTNNFIQTATNRLRLRIKMKTFGICLILHQLASPVLAGQSPTAGFRWGDWSEWEPCVKVGKNHRRRRICFGPIVNKKIDKINKTLIIDFQKNIKLIKKSRFFKRKNWTSHQSLKCPKKKIGQDWKNIS